MHGCFSAVHDIISNKDNFFWGAKMRKQIANVITISRIISSMFLLLCQAFSFWFYFIYLIAGITDMVDGKIARKLNAVSEFGSRLDSLADIIFLVVCTVKILPFINLPFWIWIWIVIIAVVKIGNITWNFICNKQLLSAHTFFNKMTGLLLFLFPLSLDFIEPMFSSLIICFIAMAAMIHEIRYIINHL